MMKKVKKPSAYSEPEPKESGDIDESENPNGDWDAIGTPTVRMNPYHQFASVMDLLSRLEGSAVFDLDKLAHGFYTIKIAGLSLKLYMKMTDGEVQREIESFLKKYEGVVRARNRINNPGIPYPPNTTISVSSGWSPFQVVGSNPTPNSDPNSPTVWTTGDPVRVENVFGGGIVNTSIDDYIGDLREALAKKIDQQFAQQIITGPPDTLAKMFRNIRAKRRDA